MAAIFAVNGILPDFESDVPLRYIHRQEGRTHIYFVANPESKPARAVCTFRVAGLAPELWDPVTGEMRHAQDFSQTGGRTRVPLQFGSAGSLFVVFRSPAGKARRTGDNFPGFETVTEMAGPWTVRFDPKWGGPESVIFDALTDWTKRPETGICYYSGLATYRASLQWAGAPSAKEHLFLNLGEVAVMARVKLNGKDLGTVWTSPYRVEITGALRQGENDLEITVANLWPNRLIGDQLLPEEKRFTWNTWNPYTKDSPLLKSGLLGPVTVLRQRAN